MGRRALLCVLALAAVPASARAELPSVESGARPGPAALYGDAAAAPQLENSAPWEARPLLVSGAIAYDRGEWLYQDHLHDDRGAIGVKDPSDPFDNLGTYLFSPRAGTLTYPTDPVFANNAADLVELRVKPLADATAFRVTLNTLQDPARTAFTIALGDGEPRAWPHGANVSSPAELFLTVHGTTAELTDAASGQAKAPAPTAGVDVRRRQYDVRVPHAAWNPGQGKVRMTIGVGLWGDGGYLQPGTSATATAPGGGNSPSGAALFNVGPRLDEPLPDVGSTGFGVTIADAAVGGAIQGHWWRERNQAGSLQVGDVAAHHAFVDFAKLAARTADDSQVPKTGPINRILASRHSFGQGVDYSLVCFSISGGGTLPKCEGNLVGNLQPYGIYVPSKKPAAGYGMTLLLHSLSANHNQYMASRNQSQLGERGGGSIVVTPSGRGPDGFYTDIAEADTFEVWADVARHYDLDPSWAAVSGYSMGGFGTYRLAARWPDLFGRAFSVVGAPSEPETLPSLRNVPIMAWAALADELVNVGETEEAQERMAELGLDFSAWLFPLADHLTLATNDAYQPGADFLGEARADRSPAHVTYVVSPASDSERAGAVADHAYWLSGLRVRDAKAAPTGTIDARSLAFGEGVRAPSGVQSTQGALDGGSRGPLPYIARTQTLGAAPTAGKGDTLLVTAKNVGVAIVDARRARLSCSPQVQLDSDGPLDLRISCPVAPRRTSCGKTVRVKLPRVRGQRTTSVRVLRGKRSLKLVKGRDVRRLALRRPTRKAFAVRVRVRARNGKTVSVVRRYPAC